MLRDFAAGVYLSEVQNTITPLTLTYCIRVYSILLHAGRGGEGARVKPKRRLEGATVHKAGSKITT
jgi:hypothetical protein